MGRQRFNKLEHIEKSNKLFESTYNKTKGLMVEQNQGSWWGDPNAVNPSSNMCVQSVNQPQSYFTGPYPNQSDCEADWVNATQGNTMTVPCYDCVNNTPTVVETIGPNSSWCQGNPNGPQCGTDCTQIDMSALGGTPSFPLVNDPNLACGQGDWWCDPTGAYVSPTGSPCLQSPNQPQSYFTGPSIDQQTCEASCGGGQGQNTCMDVQTEVCDNPGMGGQWPCLTIDGVVPDQTYIGKVIDAGSTNSSTGAPIYFKITNINPSTSAPFGTQDFPEVTTGCPGSTNSSSNCDFSWTSSCSQTHLQTGGQNSWTNFLSLRETGFNSFGCQHLQQLVNWTTNQLNAGVTGPNSANPGTPLSPVQISRKTEQLAWAQCQANECGCSPLNVPALTGGNTPTGNNSHEKIVGTVCACVGDCSGQSATIGGSISMQSATHQCNGQMCTQSDIGETFDYADGSKTLTFVLTSFSIPGVFGVSETPGIDMPSATCPTVPTPPPTDPDLIDPEVPTGKDTTPPPPQKKIPKLDDVKTLNEERERMKQMWKHKL